MAKVVKLEVSLSFWFFRGVSGAVGGNPGRLLGAGRGVKEGKLLICKNENVFFRPGDLLVEKMTQHVLIVEPKPPMQCIQHSRT